MSGDLTLDWAIMALSLFNTILLLWLGLTVLLNAERRTWGIWLTGGGLVTGSIFFLSHSAILGRGLDFFSPGVDFWWHTGWVPAIVLPFTWYVVMLWYTGYWNDRQADIHRRHRTWFFGVILVAAGLAGLLLFDNPLPSFSQVAELNLSTTLSIGGIPMLVLAYPVYLVLCMGLALDGLLRPGASWRMMGDLARRRARPWLVAATLTLLLVSLLVGGVMLWVILSARQQTFDAPMARSLAWFDLTISSLIAGTQLLIGRAIVSYEVFTGKSLPRRGLLQYWQRVIILAAGYSALISLSLGLSLRPIYSLLLSIILMTLFYALLSWRSYAERERYFTHLRPFIASPKLYDQLLTPGESGSLEVDVGTPFRALCSDVLDASWAALYSLGAMAPLAGPALVYPEGSPARFAPDPGTTARFRSPETLCLPLETSRSGEPAWAIPLWSERGLIGVLAVGEKREGGLYTQEEMEVARSAGERLVDLQAGAEIARRLMALQRERLVESQVVDGRTRRILHDEVLPRLHAAILTLSEGGAHGNELAHENERAPQNELTEAGDPVSQAVTALAEVHHQVADLLRQSYPAAERQVVRLGLIEALKQVVEAELKDSFDEVSWEIHPLAEQQVTELPALKAEVLFFAAREGLRNAARHGRGTDGTQVPPGGTLNSGVLHLSVQVVWRDGLEIRIEDDGVGLAPAGAGAHLIPGGSGQGIALHSTMMAVIGGSLAVESKPDEFTCVTLCLPREAW